MGRGSDLPGSMVMVTHSSAFILFGWFEIWGGNFIRLEVLASSWYFGFLRIPDTGRVSVIRAYLENSFWQSLTKSEINT
jgi:hypothetical protein